MSDNDIFTIAIRVVVFILMIIVGMDCSWSGLRDSLKRPFMVAGIVSLQFVLAPLVMYVSTAVAGVSMAVTVSLMLIACCPAGSISNTYCYLAGGNTPLSVALSALSVVVSMALTPLMLMLVGQFLGEDGGQLPLIPWKPLMASMTIMMLLPLVIGMSLRSWQPHWVARHQRLLRVVSSVLILALLGFIIGSNPLEVARHLRQIFVVTVLFTLLLLGAGWVLARVFRLNPADLLAVLFEFPCRNLTVAILLGMAVFNEPELVQFAAALFVIQGLLIWLALVGMRWLTTHSRRLA